LVWPAFIIMLTDGQTNSDGNWPVVTDVIGDADNDGNVDDCNNLEDAGCGHGGSSDYLDDVAWYLRHNDMRSDIQGDQTITSYFIGFGFSDGDDTSLLEDAAVNGGGQFWRADNDYSALSSVLQAAIQDILAKISSGTAVATTASSSHTTDYLYRAKFFPGSSWKGYLERYPLPFAGGAAPLEAGKVLKDRVAADGHSVREIWTYMSSKSPKKQEFTDVLKDDLKEASYWDVGDSDESRDIINYIRGDTSEDGGKYKNRGGWLLGDIIHSTPVHVGPPSGWYSGTLLPEFATYPDFRSDNSGRKKMVYVGANDGMLHAFDAATLQEDWAFIPEKLIPKLKELTVADCHQYFVDLTPYVRDVFDESDGEWKTVLFGGNARLYIVDYINAIGRTDIIKEGADIVSPRRADIGVGIPSEAVNWLNTQTADPHVFIQKSDSDISDLILHKEELGFGGRTLVNSWRILWW
jgi:type IV pilus assembly protein PilY1